MGRKSVIEIFKRDQALVKILKNHKGKENAIKSEKLTRLIKDLGYDLLSGSVHNVITKIKYEWNLPILFCHEGYYIAKNRAEIERTVAELQSRRDALEIHIEHLKSFLLD